MSFVSCSWSVRDWVQHWYGMELYEYQQEQIVNLLSPSADGSASKVINSYSREIEQRFIAEDTKWGVASWSLTQDCVYLPRDIMQHGVIGYLLDVAFDLIDSRCAYAHLKTLMRLRLSCRALKRYIDTRFHVYVLGRFAVDYFEIPNVYPIDKIKHQLVKRAGESGAYFLLEWSAYVREDPIAFVRGLLRQQYEFCLTKLLKLYPDQCKTKKLKLAKSLIDYYALTEPNLQSYFETKKKWLFMQFIEWTEQNQARFNDADIKSFEDHLYQIMRNTDPGYDDEFVNIKLLLEFLALHR